MENAILLVDDEKVILDSLKKQLSSHFDDRFVYETAENVKEAWEIIDELVEGGTEIIVIVSDWLMPGVKGDEFLVALKAKHPAIHTVLLTGHAEANAVKRAEEEGGVERVLYKPWKAAELRSIVESAVEQRIA